MDGDRSFDSWHHRDPGRFTSNRQPMITKPAVPPLNQGRTRISPWTILLLMGLWVLLSGKLAAFHLAVGVGTVLFVCWRATALAPLEASGAAQLRFLRLIPYAGWLMWQILLSAIYVARVVIHPERHLDPQLVTFHSAQPALFSGVILANSITVTPGTLTVELQDNRFVVHALTTKTARDVLDGDMARRVARLFTDEPLPPLVVITPPKEAAAR
jgi:multicomponent Na+:H+ antiporter subunit E